MKLESVVHNRGISSLYVLKAICAFFVVMIHSSMLYRDDLMFLFRMAVPCFFAITGFFLYKNDSVSEVLKAWNWTKKIFALLVGLSLLYAAFFYVVFGKTYSLRSVFYAFAVGSVPSVHLWYLGSLWKALILFAILRRFRFWSVYIIPIALLSDTAYSQFVLPNCFSAVEVWRYFHPFSALMYIAVGYYSAQYKAENIPPAICWMVFVFALVPLFFLANGAQMNVSSYGERLCVSFLYVTVVVSIISLSVRYRAFGHPFLVNIGKYHSGNIYYYHVIVKILITSSCAFVWGINVDQYSPFLTIPCTILLSMGMLYTQDLWKRLKKGNNYRIS